MANEYASTSQPSQVPPGVEDASGSSGQQTLPQPIGVPYGFAAGADAHIAAQGNHGSAGTGGPGSAPSARPPLYYEGDEYMGASRPPAQVAQLQRALARVGLLSGSILFGRWDDATRDAFAALLSLANRQGETWEQTLRTLEAQGGIGGGGIGVVDEDGNILTGAEASSYAGGGGGGGLEVRVSDPESLRSTFREVTAAMRGQGFSEEQYESMVAAYQAVERRAQERNDAAMTGANTDELYETVATPSAQDWAEAEVRRRDPSGVMSRDTLDRMNQFFSMIGASVGTGQ